MYNLLIYILLKSILWEKHMHVRFWLFKKCSDTACYLYSKLLRLQFFNTPCGRPCFLKATCSEQKVKLCKLLEKSLFCDSKLLAVYCLLKIVIHMTSC